MRKKKHIGTVLIFLLILVTGMCAFPIFNFTRSFGKWITGVNLMMNAACYAELGALERTQLKGWKVPWIAALNLSMILVSMLLRYILEFGEVSNTYNFTPVNCLVHIAAAFAVSVISYAVSRDPEREGT